MGKPTEYLLKTRELIQVFLKTTPPLPHSHTKRTTSVLENRSEKGVSHRKVAQKIPSSVSPRLVGGTGKAKIGELEAD